MILVDTSVWIDHLHRSDQTLVDLLLSDSVVTHPLVIEELALGSLARRDEVLRMFAGLSKVGVLDHQELLAFVADGGLWGRGLSPTDAHLLGSASTSGAIQIWTRDKRLEAAAGDLALSFTP
ncbi:MAG: type II toxin-antitoxin system VapC family toxin [Candidatus Nanopelagicales bacterium]|nr:type II toxin-antitoxin system VapC family toxin [Candidatus Nanopelagicales bacterium]